MAAPGQSRSETPTDQHWEVRPWQAAFDGTKAGAGQEERLVRSMWDITGWGGDGPSWCIGAGVW